jgi:hypothetical protein
MIPFSPGRSSPPSLPQLLRHNLREFPRRNEHEPTRLGAIREIRSDQRDFHRFLTVWSRDPVIVPPPIPIIIPPLLGTHTVPNMYDAVDEILSFARGRDGEELAAGLERGCQGCLVCGR